MLTQFSRQKNPSLAIEVLLEGSRGQKPAQFTALVVEDAHGTKRALDQSGPVSPWHHDQAFVDPPADHRSADKRFAQSSRNRQPKTVVEAAFVGPCEQPALHVPHRTPHLPT